MTKALIISKSKRTGLLALVGLSLCFQSPLAQSQDLIDGQAAKTVVEQLQAQPLRLEQRTQISYDSYILGPGDGLQIELLDLPELSGRFSIGPDGTLYLPRLRALYVEGLTVEELRSLLTQQFSTYVRDPKVYVRPEAYRPIRVYVGGEVRRPGYYTLTGVQFITKSIQDPFEKKLDLNATNLQLETTQNSITGGSSSAVLFPTVFDAIRSAQGMTPYTDLSQVQVTRKRAEAHGGGRIRTNLNFLSLITDGNESQNIRLFDGDILNIGKSPVVLRDQLLKAGQSNLSPQFLEVFVTGRVQNPGGVKLPPGSSLNQAISLAGGTKLLKGKVEFVRFNREGTIDRRMLSYSPGAAADAPNNPVLAAGDLIHVNDSLLSGSTDVLNELTAPFVGLYSVYSLFKGFGQ